MPLALFLNVWLISYPPPSPREWVSHSQTTMGVPQPIPDIQRLFLDLVLEFAPCGLRIAIWRSGLGSLQLDMWVERAVSEWVFVRFRLWRLADRSIMQRCDDFTCLLCQAAGVAIVCRRVCYLALDCP
ncbi:hypothetical protein [Candidatus Bathycorpusculum sp.]|uniref:hypothetical protein n=1 Tax=Candidatus Bathycorpusculum sp. TaxID=2994959 RepID=UPI00282C6E2C|nr:hypothetical protein [Candidatus Termitimicrobium sp.]MCL2686765.1 hypothetical protein [Candidatus Termitimicrobium sp.]